MLLEQEAGDLNDGTEGPFQDSLCPVTGQGTGCLDQFIPRCWGYFWAHFWTLRALQVKAWQGWHRYQGLSSYATVAIFGLAPATKPSGLDVREDLSDDFAKVGCAEWAATGKALTVLPIGIVNTLLWQTGVSMLF